MFLLGFRPSSSSNAAARSRATCLQQATFAYDGMAKLGEGDQRWIVKEREVCGPGPRPLIPGRLVACTPPAVHRRLASAGRSELQQLALDVQGRVEEHEGGADPLPRGVHL